MFLTAVLLAQVATATATPRPIATIAPKFITQKEGGGLATTAKGRKLNRSVSFDQRTVPDAPTPATRKAPATGMPSSAPTPFVQRDQKGRGEEHWHDRYLQAKSDVDRAESELALAKKDLQDLKDRVTQTRTATVVTEVEYDYRLQRVRRAESEAETANRHMEELRDECRRAGCLPGWVR
ncbi:MAG: hypothetical protein EDX89_22605 [Acidobacteria bacterium]|nr:MAG: hypothetical protein EDX89_22605 [Acidobacteriota bacterium]